MDRYVKLYFFWGLLALGLAVAFLFFVKSRVLELSRNLKTVNQAILTEQENIHILRAEYSYLTSPSRIKKLAAKYLDLRLPTTEKQLELSEVNNYLQAFVQREEPESETKLQEKSNVETVGDEE